MALWYKYVKDQCLLSTFGTYRSVIQRDVEYRVVIVGRMSQVLRDPGWSIRMPQVILELTSVMFAATSLPKAFSEISLMRAVSLVNVGSHNFVLMNW